MKHTKESLLLTQKISTEMEGTTFHHHYHILFDILQTFPEDYNVNYVEIGCYAGGSACLVSQRKNTNIFSIDLGTPIDPIIPSKNMEKFNINKNKFHYIQGNSQTQETLGQLKKHIDNIDVLFIDGDHRTMGVRNDFELYSPLVNSGGYIVFDDYNDYEYSPEVKPEVDRIISNLKGYEIIGTLPNIHGARPVNMTQGNCFIIKKI